MHFYSSLPVVLTLPAAFYLHCNKPSYTQGIPDNIEEGMAAQFIYDITQVLLLLF